MQIDIIQKKDAFINILKVALECNSYALGVLYKTG